MLKRSIVFLILLTICSKAYCQMETYYHKIEAVAYNEKIAKNLFKRIDSIKQTRRSNDSRVEVYFNRKVDFGYLHQRINITFNGVNRYHINLLTRNDSIYFSSVLYDEEFSDEAEKLNVLQNHPKTDTLKVLEYLKRRNNFYGAKKTINNLKDELNLNETYAFYCGDGNPKTKKGKQIEALVAHKDLNSLKKLINSICCEQQAYGTAGIKMLEKKGVTISDDVKKLATYIDKRNSELVVCNGCINGLVKTNY